MEIINGHTNLQKPYEISDYTLQTKLDLAKPIKIQSRLPRKNLWIDVITSLDVAKEMLDNEA